MVDTEKIKGAFDSFENDDFLAAKEVITQEIKNHMNDYFKEKLDLKDDVVEVPKEEADDDVNLEGDKSTDDA